MRYIPRSSVTPANLFPVASFEAVTVTPGSTAPVESVTVPVSTASCANAATGSSRITPISSTRLAIPEIMDSPSVKRWNYVPREICGVPETTAYQGVESRAGVSTFGAVTRLFRHFQDRVPLPDLRDQAAL